jgi:hypothetical protein
MKGKRTKWTLNFVGKCVGKHRLGKLWGWKDNIKMDITELGYESGKWIELTQDHV